ncbi:hypothetical protein [Phycicoccus sp. Soil802]|uniref:hypothetical protein n=1 Tax=Phycicoccus sp. Soil802 TaxID=1736414 RepID=UPI0007033376|nr:hypothetical protein [Phycicoccus sp. Soil802]KRF22379.1 hypothetical protein ASG91_18905 [Phycicoccus sp. Soil802]
MTALQVVALVVCLAVALTAIALFARVIRQFLAVFRLGQPDATRTGDKGARTVTLLREFLGHTRMSRLPVVVVAHWFTMISDHAHAKAPWPLASREQGEAASLDGMTTFLGGLAEGMTPWLLGDTYAPPLPRVDADRTHSRFKSRQSEGDTPDGGPLLPTQARDEQR